MSTNMTVLYLHDAAGMLHFAGDQQSVVGVVFDDDDAQGRFHKVA